MVALDHEFKIDLRKLTEDELMERRYRFFSGLYNGYEGSIDNVGKKALIEAIDRELDRRHKKSDNKRASIAVAISVIALLLSLSNFGLDLWSKIINP